MAANVKSITCAAKTAQNCKKPLRVAEVGLSLKKTHARGTDGIDEECPVEEKISSLATCFCNDKASVTGCPMQSPVFRGACRVMIRTHRIA
jgi:hypothetical protein